MTLRGDDLRAFAAQGLLLAAAYFASAKLGLALAYAHGSVTAVWPPTGIALAALVIWGYRFWPAVALGAFMANVTTDVSTLTALGIAVGNTLEALVGAALLSRLDFRPSLARVKDVVSLVLCAAALSTMVSATIGTTSLLLGGAIKLDQLGLLWRLWWLGDMGGDLLVAPVLMALASRPWRGLTGWRIVEAGGLVVALVGVTVLAFSSEMPLAYLAFPGLVVAALRFRQLGASVGSLVVASIAVWITARGGGPFTGAAPDDGLLVSQTFFGVGALTALLLAAILTERERAEREVRRSYSLLSAVAEGTPDPVYVKDAESRYLMINSAGIRAIGRSVEEVLGRRPTELFSPDVARGLIDDDRRVMSTGRAEAFEEELRSASGARTFLSVKSPLRDERGEVSGVTCISHDITDRKRIEDTQRFLADTSKVLAASLDLEPTLDAVARSAVPGLGDWCVVHMLDDDGALRPVAIAHADPDKEALVRELTRRYPPDPNAQEGIPKVVRTGRSELIPEIPDSLLRAAARDSEHLALIERLGLRSAMVVPLRARGRMLGGLALASAESDRRFDEDDLRRAEDLAARCAMAADNARLYRHEHTVAETLQRSLLPERLPQLAGIELAARYLPGSAAVDVGGDWYDVIRRPDGALVLVMGDVAGRGLRAASAMGQLRNAVRAYALEGRSPAAILAAVNGLAHAVELNVMATMLCVVYEPTTGVLRLASAGHLPPLAISPEGDVRALAEGRSVPLNVDGAARFAEAEDRLEPGSTLLLYTDGLVERSQGTLAEGLRLLRLTAAEGPKTCEALCDHIVEHVLGAAERRDDVALVALQTLPVGKGRLRLRRPASPTALAETRRALGRWLEEVGATREETFSINLAAGEACSNAIEHAYGPADAELEIEADLADDSVAVTVRDFGRWRPPRGENRGRGLVLMRGLMDAVEVIHGEDGTAVRMSRRLASAAGRQLPQSAVAESATESRAQPPARGSPTPEPATDGTELRLTREDDLVIATLDGEVDTANAQRVFAGLAGELEDRALGLILDLSGTRYFDSAGLQALFELERRMRARGQQLRLVAPDESPLRQALDLVHVRESVAVDAELNDAVGAFRPRQVPSRSSRAPS